MEYARNLFEKRFLDFQKFLRKGDIVETIASINDDLKTIVLVDHDCYVKYLEKGKDIK